MNIDSSGKADTNRVSKLMGRERVLRALNYRLGVCPSKPFEKHFSVSFSFQVLVAGRKIGGMLNSANILALLTGVNTVKEEYPLHCYAARAC